MMIKSKSSASSCAGLTTYPADRLSRATFARLHHHITFSTREVGIHAPELAIKKSELRNILNFPQALLALAEQPD